MTFLNTPVSTPAQAQTFVNNLNAAGKLFNFEEPTRSVRRYQNGQFTDRYFTDDECVLLDQRLIEICSLQDSHDYDVFEYLLEFCK